MEQYEDYRHSPDEEKDPEGYFDAHADDDDYERETNYWPPEEEFDKAVEELDNGT